MKRLLFISALLAGAANAQTITPPPGLLPSDSPTITGNWTWANNRSLAFTDTSGTTTTTLGTTSGNIFQLTGSTSGGGTRTVMSFPMRDATNSVTWPTPHTHTNRWLLSNSFAFTTTATPIWRSNSNAMTGSVTSGDAFWNQISISSDSVDTTTGGSAPGGAQTFFVGSNIGGLTLTGNRTNISSFLNVNSATNNTGGEYYYAGLGVRATASVNDGGTGGDRNGNLFAENLISVLQSGATDWNSIVGSEIDVSVETGASVSYVVGLQIVRWLNDAVAGTQGRDNALQFANSPTGASPGWDKLISFGAVNGWWPLKAAGTLIGTDTGVGGGPSYAAAYGLKLDAVAFSTASIVVPGLTVGPTGYATWSRAVSLSAGSGAVIQAGDSTTANSNPLLYSYVVGSSSGAFSSLGFNAYSDTSGVTTRVNTSKNAWRFTHDVRNATNDAALILNVVSSAGSSATAATFSTAGDISATGYLSGTTARIGTTALTQTTGSLGMLKITASGSAPGATGAKFEVVCGTNAGTAKLVMYAGTSSMAVNVVDNVGSGVTGC